MQNDVFASRLNRRNPRQPFVRSVPLRDESNGTLTRIPMQMSSIARRSPNKSEFSYSRSSPRLRTLSKVHSGTSDFLKFPTCSQRSRTCFRECNRYRRAVALFLSSHRKDRCDLPIVRRYFSSDACCFASIARSIFSSICPIPRKPRQSSARCRCFLHLPPFLSPSSLVPGPVCVVELRRLASGDLLKIPGEYLI